MSEMINLYVDGFTGKKFAVVISKDATVDQLYKKVFEKLRGNMSDDANDNSILLLYAGPSSMKDYCLSRINDCRYTFPCPECEVIWDFVLVRHVAFNCLDNETRSKIEKNLSEISIRQGRGFQQCPGCQIWCTPINRRDIRLRCPVCCKTRGRPYDFCWACQREWKGAGVRYCGNEGCDGKDPRIKVLRIAAENRITIDNVPGCPSIRSCPKCGVLINHTGGCRHMTCSSCGAEFCFICLKRWKMCSLPHRFRIAPVQDILPDPSWEDRPTPPPTPTPRPAADNGGGCVIL